MCGIAGILHFDGRPTDAPALRRMAAALAHRGPDDEGFYVAGPVGFAHRRLAIIDPAAAQQPFLDRDSGMALTYNGEVYNFVEIRRALDEAGFTTNSDTEVVLRAWRRWGSEALDRFRGMFAFALHDPRANTVFLVRDRLGIKPLYYRSDARTLSFASELGALLQSGDPAPEIDREALSLYLRFGYVPTPLTIYRGIRKLEPGTCLAIDLATGAMRSERYWQLAAAPRPRPESEALAELEALLHDTMRVYVRSDVRFGAFLSGGVDSSLVAGLMSEVLAKPVRSFSIGFTEASHSELPYAEDAARRIGAEQCSRVLDPEASPDLLSRLAARFGEPFADSSCLPTWYVSRLAAGEVKMVLSGDGGDELFAGYQSYATVFDRSALRPVYRALAWAGGSSRVGQAASRRAMSWRTLHHRQRDTFAFDERLALSGDTPAASDDDETGFPAGADPVTRCQLRDIGTYLLDDILVKVDRMSMDNSLEVRVPLLDHKIVEFALSLPLDLRLRRVGGTLVAKYLLKRAAERFYPRAFLDRPKWGFGIPIEAWLTGPLQPMVRDLLTQGAQRLAPLLDPAAVRSVVDGFYAGQRERVGQVWTLLSLRLWFDAAQSQASAMTRAYG